MIILDFGSGDTCKNDKAQIKDMIDQLAEVDKERKCIIKWQLFSELDIMWKGAEIKELERNKFDIAHSYATEKGFKTTASVYRIDDARYLILNYDIPFIKIACQTDKYEYRKHIYNLINYLPRGLNVVASAENPAAALYLKQSYTNIDYMLCVPSYPASIKEYENGFRPDILKFGISDHTVGLDLYNKYKPQLWEKHYCLDYQTSADKEWSITPQQLKGIL